MPTTLARPESGSAYFYPLTPSPQSLSSPPAENTPCRPETEMV